MQRIIWSLPRVDNAEALANPRRVLMRLNSVYVDGKSKDEKK